VRVGIPVFLLTSKNPDAENPTKDDTQSDRDSLLQSIKTLVVAFHSSRAAGLEPWVVDRDVPPLSFVPGHRLFGTNPVPGAVLLRTWSSVDSGEVLDPLALPDGAPHPVAAFPSNDKVVGAGEYDATGLVLY